MKIPLEEITESAKEIRFSETIGDLNDIYERDQVRDFRFPPALDVHLVYYRSSEEIFFHGAFRGDFEGCCSRCLASYSFHLEQPFDFMLAPSASRSEAKVEELRPEDMGLSYYSSGEINLAPLIKEQVLLALPTRPLCGEDCLGLCDGCGANLNREACTCQSSGRDPRMAVFRTLKISR
ncbi:MAG TPA: DUF177 domain-containing protein [candidate division Zixibacteria bacterium]|nr:DUF177 domain-containing protein [candidate division Zixibacteria bacterium]